MKKQIVYLYVEGMLKPENKVTFHKALRILNEQFEYRLLAYAIIKKGALFSAPMKIKENKCIHPKILKKVI